MLSIDSGTAVLLVY